MKKLLSKKNKVKSMDIKSVSNLKKKLKNQEELNNTFNNMSPLYHDIFDKKKLKESKNEINILSNANVNILKTLSTFAKEEILNNSYDFTENKQYKSKINHLNSLPELKSRLLKNKISPKRVSKKISYKKKFNSKLSELSLKSDKTKNYNKLIQNFSFNKNKPNHKKKHKRNSVINIKNNYLSNIFLDNIKEDKLSNLKNIPNNNLAINYELKTKINYEEFINEMEIIKINNNLRKDINFIKLRKNISRITNSIKTITPKEIKEKNKKNILIKEDLINFDNKSDKFRILKRINILYDSLDDEEYKEEIIGFYISPDSLLIKIFDVILLILASFYSIFVPFLLSKNYFSNNSNIMINYILILVDIIYLIDCILNLFKGYKNFDEHLIIKRKKIIRHYIKTWFLIDFLQAIPFFTLFVFNIFSVKFNFDCRFEIFLYLKIIKLYKMFYYNINIANIGELLSSKEIVDKYGGPTPTAFIMIVILNMTSCLFIFLGNNSYPGWIVKINMQDEYYFKQYLTSFYFIIVTITTVGYGDITGISNTERGFQIYLLVIGTIAYSYVISYISNQIIKQNKRSMNFEKNLEIIQEIKLHHQDMKESLYNEVLRNLYNMNLYERKDKHILLDSLPYSLKNQLIISMYQKIINNFIFFKNIDNSDFIAKVVTSFVPIISIKNDIIIQEGDFITEIIFVKKGIVSLNINFDLTDVESSIKKYYYNNKIGKLNVKYLKNSSYNKHKLSLDDPVYLDTSIFSKDTINTERNNNTNNKNIKIVEIRNNEHFGDALMFLNERSPLNAKIRTRTAELLALRKLEAIEIYSLYPNIWKRINKKSLHNMEQIYSKIKKSVIKFAKINNININMIFNKNNNKKRKHINHEKHSFSNLKNNLAKNKKENSNIKNKNIEQKKDMDKKEVKIENINNITNRNLTNNINISFVQIGSGNYNKKENIISNLNNLPFPKIKEYFNNSLKLYQGKSLKTEETQLNEKEKKHSSLSPCISILNETLYFNSNYMGNEKLYSKKEKLLYNSFINLQFSKEKNFQIKSSYENINKLSHDKYIKDQNLQLKIKNILKKLKNEKNIGIIKNQSLLNTVINFNKQSSFKSILHININEGDITNKNKYDIISLNDKNNSLGKMNINEEYQRFNSNKKIISLTNILENNTLKSTSNYLKKFHRNQTRKKTAKINKQLNLITKNIENTSKNINNPEKFYSNFFKNIIDKDKQISNSNNKTPNARKNFNKNNTSLFKYYLQDNVKKERNMSIINYRRRRNSNE